MARITAFGGVFVHSANPEALAAWYRDKLGLTIEDWGGAMIRAEGAGPPCGVWSAFNKDTALLDWSDQWPRPGATQWSRSLFPTVSSRPVPAPVQARSRDDCASPPADSRVAPPAPACHHDGRGNGIRRGAGPARPDDRIKELQTAGVANQKEKAARPYHFGSQGPDDVFSNHASHTNRLVPVYVFGRKADLGAVTGKNSLYRDPEKIKALYGFLPENTVNPDAEYADQSDLYRVQRDAVARGVQHLFIVWFDGLDWPTTQAAAIVKTGKVYTAGKGSGLIFQDYTADGTAQFGYVVTSPTHDKNTPDVDAQTVVIPPTAWAAATTPGSPGRTPGPSARWGLKAPGYLKGQSANAADQAGVKAAGGVLHAYTDSSTSAAEVVSGRKAYNNGINVTDDGTFVPTLFHELQGAGVEGSAP